MADIHNFFLIIYLNYLFLNILMHTISMQKRMLILTSEFPSLLVWKPINALRVMHNYLQPWDNFSSFVLKKVHQITSEWQNIT